MKQFTFIICFLLWTLHGYTQKKIEKIEYFFNTDPGLGKGSVVVPGNIDSLVNFDLNIPVANIPEGFNRIYFRVKDNRGRWSCTSSRLVFKSNVIAASSKIRQAEYFIDTDPGPGKATSFSISQGLETIDVSQTINIEGLAQGFHNIYIRVMDSRGVWSITGKRLFLVYSIRSNETLTNIEYFIDQDPGIGKGTSLNFSQNNGQAIVDYNIDISALSKGFHHLYTRVRSSSGKWSQTGKRVFFIKEKDAKDFSNITGLEYFIANADTSTRIFYFPLPKPQPFLDTANLIWLKDSLKLAINKRYSLYVRAVDEKGNKSPFTSDKFMFYDSIPKGDIPMNVWVPFEVAGGSPFKGNVYAGEVENLFALVKKADRLGYDATWGGEFSLIKDDKQLEKSTGSTDYDIQLTVPEGGFYDFELTTHNTKSSGFIKFTEYPDTLRLNQWDKGEILRPYGYDWKCFDVKEETDTFFIQTEGYGMWSTIEVFYENINQKTNYWQFSNMGEGYHIKGFIKAPKKGRYYIRYKDSAVLYDKQDDDKSTQRREYLVYVGGNQNFNVKQDLFLKNIFPSKIGQDDVTITIKGGGFSDSTKIVFKHITENYQFILSPSYVNSSKSEISIQNNFKGIQSGEYSLLIIEQNDTIKYPYKLTIDSIGFTDLWVKILGRDKIRIGRKQKYIIKYGNNGNIDSNFSLLYINLPKNLIDTFNIKHVKDENLKTITYNDINYIYIPNIGAGNENFMTLELFSTTTDTFQFSTGIDCEKQYNKSILKKNLKLSKESACTDKPLEGDIVFSYFKFDTSPLVHTGYFTKKFDKDGQEREYVIEIFSSRLLFGDAFVAARRWEFSTHEKLEFQLNVQAVNSKQLSLEQFKTKWENVGVDVFDPSYADDKDGEIYKGSLKDYIVRNGDGYYIGHGKPSANLSIAEISSMSAYFLEQFQKHNKVNGTKIYNYSALYPDLYNGNKRLNGHCGNFILDYLFRNNIINAMYQFENAWAAPYKFQEYLEENGLFCPSPESKKSNKLTPVLVLDNQDNSYLDSIIKINSFEKQLKEIIAVTSTTPEDKYGPVGHSSANATLDKQEHYIDSTQLFEYRIDYWNKENATAPAAIVYIRDTLDTDFDISTLNFTEIGFLKWKVKLDGGSYFNVNVDCRPEMPYIVNVEGTVDPVTREVFWVHKTLNPKTMELPDDPLSGYLPPIDSTGYQIGWVDFNIKAKPGLPDGTLFSNQARVNFDGVGKWGPAPPYGPYINTWDKTEPVSRVLDLPAEVVADSVLVKWKGSDSGSGIKAYSVFVSNNNDYKKWINSSTDTMAWFKGEKGTAYRFYSIATDFVGNIESPKQNYEALTRFVSTGINKKHDTNEKKFLIYPNPASCCFTIQLAWIPKNIVNIEIYNTLGEHVYSAQTVIQKTEIDLGQLPKGIYIIKVLNNSEIFYQNLILQ